MPNVKFYGKQYIQVPFITTYQGGIPENVVDAQRYCIDKGAKVVPYGMIKDLVELLNSPVGNHNRTKIVEIINKLPENEFEYYIKEFNPEDMKSNDFSYRVLPTHIVENYAEIEDAGMSTVQLTSIPAILTCKNLVRNGKHYTVAERDFNIDTGEIGLYTNNFSSITKLDDSVSIVLKSIFDTFINMIQDKSKGIDNWEDKYLDSIISLAEKDVEIERLKEKCMDTVYNGCKVSAQDKVD